MAFSFFADIVLIIAAGLASIGCVVSLIGVVVAMVAGQLGASSTLSAWAFILLALAIVFLRAQRIEPNDSGQRKKAPREDEY